MPHSAAAGAGDLEERIGMPPACTPGKPMLMNVSSGTEIVLLQPAPALPSIQVLPQKARSTG